MQIYVFRLDLFGKDRRSKSDIVMEIGMIKAIKIPHSKSNQDFIVETTKFNIVEAIYRNNQLKQSKSHITNTITIS